MAVYQVLSFPGPRLFCTIQKVGNFHATHAIMSIYNYLASSFFLMATFIYFAPHEHNFKFLNCLSSYLKTQLECSIVIMSTKSATVSLAA